MHFDEFHTCAVALAALDMQEAVDAALIAPDDLSEWNAFRADPLRWFLQADTPQPIASGARCKGTSSLPNWCPALTRLWRAGGKWNLTGSRNIAGPFQAARPMAAARREVQLVLSRS
jgi:hypothetical protein